VQALRLVSLLVVAASDRNQTGLAEGPLGGEAGPVNSGPAPATDVALADNSEAPPAGPEDRRPGFLIALLRALSVWAA